MITYHCDRCGKEIVDGTIYRVGITAESMNIVGTADALATAIEADAIAENVRIRLNHSCMEK